MKRTTIRLIRLWLGVDHRAARLKAWAKARPRPAPRTREDGLRFFFLVK